MGVREIGGRWQYTALYPLSPIPYPFRTMRKTLTPIVAGSGGHPVGRLRRMGSSARRGATVLPRLDADDADGVGVACAPELRRGMW